MVRVQYSGLSLVQMGVQMKKIIAGIAAGALLAGAIVSTASAQTPNWLADFKRADLNDSDGLSWAELEKSRSTLLQPLRENFRAIDADGDGHVTQYEYSNYLNQTQRQDSFVAKFRQMDLNDSGGISRKELDKVAGTEFANVKRNFDQIDSDHDGQISVIEYQNYQNATARNNSANNVVTNALGLPISAPRDRCQYDCGVVGLVEAYQVNGDGSALGVIAGGVAGGALGNQVGKGDGKKLATIGGAVAGAYLGRQLEKKAKTKDMVRVTVNFDNGQQRAFEFETANSPFIKGERVQLVNGQVTRYDGP